jgi:hypothetical protein
VDALDMPFPTRATRDAEFDEWIRHEGALVRAAFGALSGATSLPSAIACILVIDALVERALAVLCKRRLWKPRHL